MQNDSAVICGEFAHFRHIKTRKVVVLEIEISEELFQDAISKLGMPIGGESKPVAIALLDSQIVNKVPVVGSSNIQQTEGEKLRTRAVMLSKDSEFMAFCDSHKFLYYETKGLLPSEALARAIILAYCDIESRAELATNSIAQIKFKELISKFDEWKLENRYRQFQ